MAAANPGSSSPPPDTAAAVDADSSPWQRAEIEELRHTAENVKAELALQVTQVWRPGISTAAMEKAVATQTTPVALPAASGA